MRIGFIGTGKMAEAMISALLKVGVVSGRNIVASDISAARRRAMSRRYRIQMHAANERIPALSDVIFLAVKPQQIEDALQSIAEFTKERHVVISIAAGRKIRAIQKHLPKARIIRVMPNLPCLVSSGMNVFCCGRNVTRQTRKMATRLLSCFGRVAELPESTFDAVTALSGSGPAFFAYALDKMTDAAISEGLDRKTALMLAEQTMFGTGKLLLEKKLDPIELIESVASAKGTTAAGLAVLDASSMSRIIKETIHAAAKRSRELSA